MAHDINGAFWQRSGFSVLDVTNPIISPGLGPLHMFSVYNDYINQVVYIADEEGNITERQYTANTVNIGDQEKRCKQMQI